jgi:hypothetical protein
MTAPQPPATPKEAPFIGTVTISLVAHSLENLDLQDVII